MNKFRQLLCLQIKLGQKNPVEYGDVSQMTEQPQSLKCKPWGSEDEPATSHIGNILSVFRAFTRTHLYRRPITFLIPTFTIIDNRDFIHKIAICSTGSRNGKIIIPYNSNCDLLLM